MCQAISIHGRGPRIKVLPSPLVKESVVSPMAAFLQQLKSDYLFNTDHSVVVVSDNAIKAPPLSDQSDKSRDSQAELDVSTREQRWSCHGRETRNCQSPPSLPRRRDSFNSKTR